MSNTTCKRCGGSGLFGPVQVCGGRCFACNRGSVPSVSNRGWTRERIINALHNMLLVAKSRAAQGADDYADWLDAVTSDDAAPSLPGLLSIAPSDVRARFEAAMAKVCA
jgi:hypothetical protein